MIVDGRAGGGLRERKKRATRRALSDAALRLALDRGIDHLTVEEISEAVGVSARTFFNYFSSKEEALLGDSPLLTGELPVRSLVLEAGSVLDGLHRVIMAAAGAESRPEELRLRHELMERHPVLVPRLFARVAVFQQTLASAVAERTGGDPADTYPQLMASVACAAMQTAMRTWKAGDGGQPFGQHVDEVFGLLKNALGQEEAGSGGAGPSAPSSAGHQRHRTPAPAIADPGFLGRAADRARGGSR
jgi:AcrR family transcriptional regulator